jgi:hypothetical protein
MRRQASSTAAQPSKIDAVIKKYKLFQWEEDMKIKTKPAPDLRATIEYEEAFFFLKLKRSFRLQLRAIEADLRDVRRISREAVLLAENDIEPGNNSNNTVRKEIS